MAFSPDGGLLASARWDGTVRLWDPATGAVQAELTGDTSGVLAVAFSPDGGLLASASWDTTGNPSDTWARRNTFCTQARL